MSYVYQVIETEEQPVLAVRTVTSVANIPNIVGKVYSSIFKYLTEIGEKALGPAFMAYYNMDMENLDVEIGFPVEKIIEGKGDIVATKIPAGKKAVGFYKGAYSGLGAIYEDMTKWMIEKGLEPIGIVYENYYNSPEDVPESELLTKIEFLLK